MTASAPPPLSPLDAAQYRLDFARKLQALTHRIHSTDNVSQIMLDVSAQICDVFQCERLTLYVIDKDQPGRLISKVKTGIDTDRELTLPINHQSIAGYVALVRKTVRINDLSDPAELQAIDPELQFNAKVDRYTGFQSKQMLAAPLLQGTGGELVGVLQLINQRVDGRFDKVAEDGLETLTATLSLALFQRMRLAALIPKRYEVLASKGVISLAELELAQRWAQRKNKDFEAVLTEDFKIPLSAIGEAQAAEANLPYQALDVSWHPDPELSRKLNRPVCEKHRWLPLQRDNNLIFVLTSEPPGPPAVESIQRTFPYNEVRTRYTTKTELDRMMSQFFSA